MREKGRSPQWNLRCVLAPMMKDARTVRPYLPRVTQTYYNHFSSPPIFTPQGEVSLQIFTSSPRAQNLHSKEVAKVYFYLIIPL